MDHSVSENCLKSVLETYKIFFLGGGIGGGELVLNFVVW